MKNPLSHSASIFGLSAILVLVTSIGIRLGQLNAPAPSEEDTTSTGQTATLPTEETTTSTIPDLTSAAFTDGDALKGLGTDWTFVRQDDISGQKPILSGTVVKRESVVKAVNKETQLVLTESDIVDQKKLDAALTAKGIKKFVIAGRDGYIIPTGEKTKGTGFLLVGTNTTLLITDAASATWPSALEAAVLTYIATVHTP